MLKLVPAMRTTRACCKVHNTLGMHVQDLVGSVHCGKQRRLKLEGGAHQDAALRECVHFACMACCGQVLPQSPSCTVCAGSDCQ